MLGAAALADWVHASHYSFYLPPGINSNLIRTALWLSLASILAFYTALLHTVHHRRYGRRSVALLATVVVLSLYVVVDRRASYEPVVAPPAPFARPLAAPAPHLLVVGIEGATLDVLLPLARQGRLPFFATLFDEGSYARLESFAPVRPLGLRASLASGKLPFRHGLAGSTLLEAPWLGRDAELRLLPRGFSGLGLDRLLGGHRPVGRTDRRVRTVWEILARLDRRTAVLGVPEALLAASGGAAQASEALFRGASLCHTGSSRELRRAARAAARHGNGRTSGRAGDAAGTGCVGGACQTAVSRRRRRWPRRVRRTAGAPLSPPRCWPTRSRRRRSFSTSPAWSTSSS